MFRLSSLVFLLVISGVYSQEWKVQYPNTVKCALKGSSILLSGTYRHPGHLTVTKIFWTVNPVKGEEHINLSDHPDYKGRVEYFAKKELSTFNLKLNNVTHEDERMYCIRIATNVESQRFLGYPGVELKVTELRVEVPEEVVEKHSAVLFCKSTCDLGGRKFTWYKNGKPLSETNVNQLFLPSVSSEDAGKYSCAVRDQKDLSSPAVNLNIRYPPRNVSVSISGSSEVLEGDSVRLICSSDSNPPALTFSWFQENHTSAVGSGQSFSISSFNSSLSGRFYCEAHNKYGSQRSHAVSLSVKESSSSWVRLSVGVSVSAVVTSVMLMVFIWLMKRPNKKVESENTYMTLDPTSRRSEYDTLDNMKRSCENTDVPEDQESSYYNINS